MWSSSYLQMASHWLVMDHSENAPLMSCTASLSRPQGFPRSECSSGWTAPSLPVPSTPPSNSWSPSWYVLLNMLIHFLRLNISWMNNLSFCLSIHKNISQYWKANQHVPVSFKTKWDMIKPTFNGYFIGYASLQKKHEAEKQNEICRGWDNMSGTIT